MRPIQYLSRDQLVAVSHPLRQRILDLLVERGELSGREVGELIPGAPANPYYHLDVLRNAGLIRVVRTARRRGVTEKYYGSVAQAFALKPEELRSTTGEEGRGLREGIVSVAREGAESALHDLSNALATGAAGGSSGEAPLVNMCRIRLRPERADELRTLLSDVLKEAMTEANAADGRCRDYVVFQLFFPRVAG